jgi:hypothetical protein
LARSFTRISQLSEAVQTDILRLVEKADEILKFLKETATDKPSAVPRKFAEPLAQRLAIPVREAGRLLNALQNLQSINQETGDHERSYALIENILSGEARERWSKSKPIILQILEVVDSDHPAVLSEKARRITHLYEGVFLNAEMLTDIRPVFTIKGDRIVEMVVQHKLMITEHNSEHQNVDHHFVLDARDVINLKMACERAIQKAQALKDAFADSPWTTEVLADDAET